VSGPRPGAEGVSPRGPGVVGQQSGAGVPPVRSLLTADPPLVPADDAGPCRPAKEAVAVRPMAQLGIDADEALARLRGRAFAQGRTALELARDVVAHRERLDVG
jgi:hypothetical protein